MKRHVLSIHHYVAELDAAIHFCIHSLQFQQLESKENFVTLDNGSIHIRLFQSTEEQPPTQLILELPTKKLDRDEAIFQEQPKLRQIKERHYTSQEREEAHFAGPHGFTLVLSRLYDEDELGLTPELNMNLCWDEEAESFLKDSLRLVPVVFRDLARKNCTEKAEALAMERGKIEVELDHSVRAFIREEPFYMHEVLYEELGKTGFDMSPYQDEFMKEKDS